MTHDRSETSSRTQGCRICAAGPGFEFTMAFQPLVDLANRNVYGYEALVRGVNGEGAGEVLSRLTKSTLYRFDQACRIKALEIAHGLGARTLLSINFLPNAVYEPTSCIQATLEVSERLGWPAHQISFEITETEYVRDRSHMQHIIDTYREMGFRTALDDFGTGYANLDLLVDLNPDVLKLDRALIRDIDRDLRKQAIVNGVVETAGALGISLIAEGVETIDEARWLYRKDITHHQGFLYARPQIETLPVVDTRLIDSIVEPDMLASTA